LWTVFGRGRGLWFCLFFLACGFDMVFGCVWCVLVVVFCVFFVLLSFTFVLGCIVVFCFLSWELVAGGVVTWRWFELVGWNVLS
jgi:hypothetical protein